MDLILAGILVLLFCSGLFALAGFKLRITPFIQYACFFFAIIWLFLAMTLAGMGLTQGDPVLNSTTTTILSTNSTQTLVTYGNSSSATSGLLDIGIYVFGLFIMLMVMYIGYKLFFTTSRTLLDSLKGKHKPDNDYFNNDYGR